MLVVSVSMKVSFGSPFFYRSGLCESVFLCMKTFCCDQFLYDAAVFPLLLMVCVLPSMLFLEFPLYVIHIIHIFHSLPDIPPGQHNGKPLLDEVQMEQDENKLAEACPN